MAEEKGTGKHPHKDSKETWPHTEGSQSEHRSESRSEDSGREDERSASGSSQGGPSSSRQDLKEREYRDNEGNIHHHTHTSEAMNERKAS